MEIPAVLNRRFKKTEDVRAYWENGRRQELLELFSRSLYGRIPARMELDCVEASAWRKKSGHRVKQIVLGTEGFRMRLILHLPAREGKYPVILYLCLAGQREEFVPIRLLVEGGFAVAVIFSEEIARDSADAQNTGIFCRMKGENIPEGAAGNLAAWAWGIEQARRQLLKESCVRGDQISVAGYSRGGKAALYACALYGGFFSCSAVHSGCCGASLFRKIPEGKEGLREIYSTFPYWFAKNAEKYAQGEEELPVDQHMLLALCAPVRLCILNADEDPWCDREAEKMSCRLAADIFNLYPQERSHIFYKVRKGNHEMEQSDWEEIMRVAQKYRLSE